MKILFFIFFHLIILFRFVVCSDNRRWTCDLSSATELLLTTALYTYHVEHVFRPNIIIQCRPHYNGLRRWNYFNNALVKLSLLEHNEKPFLFICCVCVCKYNVYTYKSTKTLHAIHQSIIWCFLFRLVLHFTCWKSDDGLNSNSLWSTLMKWQKHIMDTYSES